MIEAQRVCELDLSVLGEDVVSRRDEDEAVGAVGEHDQILGADAAIDNADFGGPFGQGADDADTQLLAKVDADIWMGGQERRQDTGQKLRDRSGVRKDTDVASNAFGVLSQVVLQLLRMQQHQSAVVQKRLPRRSQRDAARSRGSLHVALDLARAANVDPAAKCNDVCYPVTLVTFGRKTL